MQGTQQRDALGASRIESSVSARAHALALGGFIALTAVAGLALASASVVAATNTSNAVTPTTASMIQNGYSPVLRDLLAGRDARAAVAAAQDEHPQGQSSQAAASQSTSSTAFGTYASSLQGLSRALGVARNAETVAARTAAHSSVAHALDTVRASRLLMDARIEQIDNRVRALSAETASRWEPSRASVLATLSSLDDAVTRASMTLSASAADTLPAFDDLAALLAATLKLDAAPIYGAATLPVFRPRLAPRDPQTSPVITPSYADAENDNAPVAEDYAATADAPLSPAILQKAQSLDHDYTRIFDFVRSQVSTEWYAGAQKGAEATLRTLAGNDADQASLLIALLRASGAPARYVRGVIEVPVGKLASMLGVREDQVGPALVAAGVANRPTISGGRVSGFAIEHIYVSAYLPFTSYRGTAADLDGRAWVPLMPALKPHAFAPASGALSTLGLDVDEFVTQYLLAVQTSTPWEMLRQQVTGGLAALSPPLALSQQLSQWSVAAPALELLPASTPVPVTVVTGEFAKLPESLHQKVRIVVRSGTEPGDPVVMEQTLPASRLIDQRVTLAYQPASIDDGIMADKYGGLGGVPASLIHVRPVLNIAGQPGVAGSGELAMGAAHRIEITISGPAGKASMVQQLIAGGMAALVFDAQGDSPPQQADGAELPGDSEGGAARLLANFGARYLSTWGQSETELARLIGVSVVRPFPSVVLVINQYRVDGVGGVDDAMAWRGVALDAALHPVEPFAQTDNDLAPSHWLQMTSLQGSVLEHRLFEQQWSVDSISADKGLALARANGQAVLTLTQATGVSGVNQPQHVLDAISRWLNQGYTVDVPRDPLTYESWSGTVWRVYSPTTGESGYFIAGALAGGSTAMPPELWYFQDLVQLLGDPYGQEPNTDPASGVILTLDAAAQYQIGVVDSVLPIPLRATVLDAAGRPVRGAQVAFTLTTGTAKLLDDSGTEAGQLVVATDSNGSAMVRVHLGTEQGDYGSYSLDPGQTYPQWLGLSTIEVTAASTIGTLYAGQPYREYASPDAPSKIRFFGAFVDLIPQMSYTSLGIAVTDQFDNRIANVPVSISASTQYQTPSCSDGTAVSTIDASLFVPGQCPTNVIQLTGNACVSSSIALTSRSGGSPFFVVPPATGLATVSLSANAAGVSDSLQLTTDAYSNPCAYSGGYAISVWNYSPIWGERPMLAPGYQFSLLDIYNILDAAPPGEVMAHPQRVDAFTYELVEGTHAGVIWTPEVGAEFTSSLQNGSIDSIAEVGGGSYLMDLRAGLDPGPVHGNIYLTFQNNRRVPLPGAPRSTTAGKSSESDDLNFAWAVVMDSPKVTPERVPLTPFGATDVPIHLALQALPEEYLAAPVRIDLLEDDEVITSCSVSRQKLGQYDCTLSRGRLIDTSKTYTARTVIDDGTPFRMESASTTLQFGQGIVGGYGMLPPGAADGGGGVLDVLALVQGRYPTELSINQPVDIPTGYTCDIGETFGYYLAQDATVTLAFHKLNEFGDPSPLVEWTAIDAVATTEGLHDVVITSSDLPIGDYEYELIATSSDGTTETYTGVAAHHVNRRDSLPLGHPFVKGVDLFSGGATVSTEDIAIGGRGPGMRLTRSYASHRGNMEGWFGRGWSSSLESQVLVDACNTRVVTGAAGQGRRFAVSGTGPDGEILFTALNGYHGTLVQIGAEYDYHATDGTRYHFGQFDLTGPRLSYIEDSNGNRTNFTYELNYGKPHVTRVEDASGRHIDLNYAIKEVERDQSGFTIHDSFHIVSDAYGPGGLHLHYEYDDFGNLAKVTRSDGSSGERVQGYAYTDLGGIWSSDPNGKPLYFHFGFRLTEAANLLDGGKRTYAYQLGWSGVLSGDDGEVLYVPEQRVSSVTEPDGGVTSMVYPELRGLGAVTTKVTDARSNTTNYALNYYGAATAVTNAAGTTQTAWDMLHIKPLQITDALGTITSFAYDDAGNKTAETITNDWGSVARSWTFVPQSQFEPLKIRNRVAVATDANGHATGFEYDAHGNLTSTTRGGIAESDGYDENNGDHISHSDGLGHVTLWRYDTYGYVREAEDPLGNVTSTAYDERGRVLSKTDANGHATSYTWDARDRLLTTTYPETAAGVGIARTIYNDVADFRRDTTPNHPITVSTVSTFDNMGRLIAVEYPEGNTRTLEYDKNGNLTEETDFSGNVTTHDYDAANRRTQTHAPENQITLYEYDGLDHLTKQTVQGTGSTPRITEYKYEHPLYKRTLVRRHLDASTFADETSQYDLEGQVTQITDAVGRVTTRSYDARNRLAEEHAPYGKSTIVTYFADDKVSTSTIKNPGHADQVTAYAYDAAGRRIAITDAAGDTRTTAYDAVGNVVSQSDARGNLTRSGYNARNQLVQVEGPETDQITSYTYDLGGNRVTETWPNGNVRQFSYDFLERHTRTTDSVGLVESFTYTPDGQVATHTDANGHVTSNHYDGLHRLEQQDLPKIDGVARTILKTYNVHGDELSVTDPGGHETTYTYDGLGRRVSITLPASTGRPAATTHTGYDLIDRSTSSKDARGNVTTITYDDQAYTRTQTDPSTPDGSFSQVWAFDALGNVIQHTDRRGIVTANTYDALNRLLVVSRDGLVTTTRTYEEGLLATVKDANGNLTRYRYDDAARKIADERPLGFVQTWTYTPMDDIASVTDADGRVVTHTYTPRRYLETVTNNAGETTTYSYDGKGNRTAMQRPMGPGYTFTYTYDEGDRLLAVSNPEGGITRFAYDLDGNKLAQTNANAHTTSFSYDARHQRSSKTYPAITSGAAPGSANPAATYWKYDPDGHLIEQTTANGRVITYSIDALGRTTAETVTSPIPGEIASVAWHFDGNGNVTTITETIDGASRSASRSYDAFDRLDTSTDVHGSRLLYAYDANGNRTRLTDQNSGEVLTAWGYDALNRNVSVTADNASTGIEYYPSGKTHSITRPGGSTSTTEYDQAGRTQSITHLNSGNVEIAHVRYDYDLNGNRWHQYQANGALTNNTEQTTTYSYDQADRLTNIDAPERDTHYQLDGVGNRTDESINGESATLISHSTLTYNEREQLTSRVDAVTGLNVDLTYDADGNTQTETDATGTRTTTWDAHDRAIVVTPAAAVPIHIDYQSNGLRIAKHQGASETRFRYDQQTLLAETNAIGNVLARYHYSAHQLLSRSDPNADSTRHYLNDALGTPIATINQGAVDSRTQYDAWGQIIRQQGTSGAITEANNQATHADLLMTDQQPVGFTGYYKDQATGLYYAKARYYDPQIARFTSEDPETGNAMQPPSLHRYLYAYGNPLIYVDPTGRCNTLYMGPAECEQMALEQAALMSGVDLSTDEGYRKALKFQAGRRSGQLRGAWNAVKDAALFVADVPGSALDLVPGVDVGSLDRMGDRAKGLWSFVTSPIQTIKAGVKAHNDAYVSALANGDYRGAGTVHGAMEGGIVASAVMSYAGAGVSKLTRLPRIGARRVVEGANGDARAVPTITADAGYNLDRRMELIADSDFGPLNRLTHEERIAGVGDHIVSFGGPKTLLYNDRSDATLGGKGFLVWAMPLDDAARLQTRSDVVTQTGHAPSVTDAFLRGDTMYGVSVPTDRVNLRSPNASDGGSNHWRAGGHTGVEHNGRWRQNSTREFVTDGGKPMPRGSVLFRVNPDGSWTPIRRF